jgi:hypothetical protein
MIVTNQECPFNASGDTFRPSNSQKPCDCFLRFLCSCDFAGHLGTLLHCLAYAENGAVRTVFNGDGLRPKPLRAMLFNTKTVQKGE